MVQERQAEKWRKQPLCTYAPGHGAGVKHSHDEVQEDTQHHMYLAGKAERLDYEEHHAQQHRQRRQEKALPAEQHNAERKQHITAYWQHYLRPRESRVFPHSPAAYDSEYRRDEHQGDCGLRPEALPVYIVFYSHVFVCFRIHMQSLLLRVSVRACGYSPPPEVKD